MLPTGQNMLKDALQRRAGHRVKNAEHPALHLGILLPLSKPRI